MPVQTFGAALLRQPMQSGLNTTIAAVTLVVGGAAAIFLAIEHRHFLGTLQLTKEQADYWDVVVKAVGGGIALSGAFFAVSRYLDETSKANHAAMIEARKPFMQKRQDIYYDLVLATATISNKGPGDPLRVQAETNFWLLFWGALPLVADLQVGGAVNRFSEALDNSEDVIALRNASMNLAQACRASLGYAPPSEATR
jgi:hypothetical protein